MQNDEPLPGLDDPLIQNSRIMLAKLVKQKLIVLKPPNDKLIDLVLKARLNRQTSVAKVTPI